MKPPHPASVLVFGFAALLAASSRNGTDLFLAFLVPLLLAVSFARVHLFALLRRSRWLLLAMLLMFGWLTPGTPLPGIPGASREGLLLGAESLGRLMIALACVALILKMLAPAELVAGMRTLLAPLDLLKISRDRIAVRLALTMQEVEASRRGGQSGAEPESGVLSLPAVAPGTTDLLLGALSAALLLGAVFL